MPRKSNRKKNGRCPDCDAPLHKEDYTDVQHGSSVHTVVLCSFCGYEGIVETEPTSRAMKRSKKART